MEDSLQIKESSNSNQNEEKKESQNNNNEINIKSEINENNDILNNKEENEIKNKNNIYINKDKKNYISEAKFYINLNVKDNDYFKSSNKDYDSFFEIISEEKIMKWEIKLFNDFNYYKTITEDMITKVQKDTSFQLVIKNDVNRTRVRESILIENFRENLENIITFYCKSKNIYYKQGLNEIFGPLILLKYKIKRLKLAKIFLFGETFIDKFLPNYYYETDFCALKGSLRLFFILLKYHEPSVYNLLDKNEILPEMYATNWIMTLMSGKLRLDILFNLWDNLLSYDDPLFIHFIFVSLLIYKRELIINCQKSLLPSLMANLTILTKDELNDIIKSAENLRLKTPYSFRILVNKLGIQSKCENLKERFEKYKPEMIQAIPIFPQEIFYMQNRNKIKCPNPDCINGINPSKIKHRKDFDIIYENKDCIKGNNRIEEIKEKEKIYKSKCEKCDMKIEKEFDYVLIDLRIIEKEDNMMDRDGFWKKIIVLNQDELKSEGINEILAERYIDLRGTCHFVFLTSTTDTFNKFETDFYKNNMTNQDKLKIIYGIVEQTKIDKELDLNAGHLTSKEIYKLKEYDNLRKTLKSMQNQNYPYISFIYGGYNKMHEDSVNLDLVLRTHNSETCIICQEIRNKNKNKANNNLKEKGEEKEKKNLYKLLWEHKRKIKYKNLVQYFKDSNISILFGSLTEYKGKNLIFEKIQILIAILFSQYKIEIYKFDIKKQQNSTKSNYYDLGLNFEQQKDIDLIILEELKISDILGLSIDKKIKNVINLNIKDKNKEINEKKIKKGKKEDIIKLYSYNIAIDLSSSNDAKNFFKSFKKMSVEFKAYINKK